MSWSIVELKNEPVLSKKCAADLLKAGLKEGHYHSEDDLADGYVVDGDGHVFLNIDHMEHMDFLWDDWAQEVLKKHKVKGDICFTSVEGDNAGRFWGYRFDGEGGMVELVGKQMIDWVAIKQKSR